MSRKSYAEVLGLFKGEAHGNSCERANSVMD